MDFIKLIFYNCLRLWFLDVETNPGQQRSVPVVYRILCSNVLGLAGHLSDLTMASSQYDILLWDSETLISDMHYVSELLVPWIRSPCVIVPARFRRPEGRLHMYQMVTEHFVNPNLNVAVVKCWFLGCVV